MKYSGLEVFLIMNALERADSTKGEGRQFIRINRGRFATPYNEAIGWVADYENDYPELTVGRNLAGSVSGFKFDTEQSTDGHAAFMKHLQGLKYEVEPHVMPESVLLLIDGIGVADEDILIHLTEAKAAEREKAQQEADTDEG